MDSEGDLFELAEKLRQYARTYADLIREKDATIFQLRAENEELRRLLADSRDGLAHDMAIDR